LNTKKKRKIERDETKNRAKHRFSNCNLEVSGEAIFKKGMKKKENLARATHQSSFFC
jgi:hypothetical protein